MLFHQILQLKMFPVKDIPFLHIESQTGFGAIIKPQIAPKTRISR